MVGIQAPARQGDVTSSLQLPEAGGCLTIDPPTVHYTSLGCVLSPTQGVDGGGSCAQRAQARGRLLRWSVR